ncbi:MAG: ATP-binding protein [Clostridiales bacterium]|nr:ATP-binding protein [Clostridiales bacterium]
MSKVKNDSGVEVNIVTLRADFKKCTDEIRKIKGAKEETKDLSYQEKNELRSKYLEAAGIAREISKRSLNDIEKEKYKENSIKLTEMAKAYGSPISVIPKTTMDDVKGLKDVKEVVKSFVFMAENPALVKHYKIDGGLGMLMYGAPGTGKTLFAEAVANSMQLPLFVVTPADIYKSYVGESEQAVKQIFEEIENCKDGAVLFVDECESIFSKRGEGTKDYKAAVTTELLQRMSGFGVDGSKRVMIAATNRPDEIDPAYLRYKRFSHIVHIPPPDEEAKKAIIESKLKGIELSDDISVDKILAKTDLSNHINPMLRGYMYSAADICGIIEEACRIALMQIEAEKGTKPIPLTESMFEKAMQKIPPSISLQTLALYENFRKKISDK